MYLVGDTPESDTRGTNVFDELFVRTGVFNEGTKPKFMAKMMVDNVLDAVKNGMQREFVKSFKAVGVLAPPAEGLIPEQAAVVDCLLLEAI